MEGRVKAMIANNWQIENPSRSLPTWSDPSPALSFQPFPGRRRNKISLISSGVLSLSDFHQCSYDNPHHIVQKTVSPTNHPDITRAFHPHSQINRTNLILDKRLGRTKRGKIVLSHQMTGSLLHRGHIKRIADVVSVSMAKHIGHRAVVDTIAVFLHLYVKAGVKGRTASSTVRITMGRAADCSTQIAISPAGMLLAVSK